jgi:hypothetical protein
MRSVDECNANVGWSTNVHVQSKITSKNSQKNCTKHFSNEMKIHFFIEDTHRDFQMHQQSLDYSYCKRVTSLTKLKNSKSVMILVMRLAISPKGNSYKVLWFLWPLNMRPHQSIPFCEDKSASSSSCNLPSVYKSSLQSKMLKKEHPHDELCLSNHFSTTMTSIMKLSCSKNLPFTSCMKCQLSFIGRPSCLASAWTKLLSHTFIIVHVHVHVLVRLKVQCVDLRGWDIELITYIRIIYSSIRSPCMFTWPSTL